MSLLVVLILICLFGLVICGAAMATLSSETTASISASSTSQSIASAQTKSSDGIWRRAAQEPQANIDQQRPDLRSYISLSLDRGTLETILSAAPMESNDAARQHNCILTLPIPDGTFVCFSIAESPILARELAARFPEIKTYIGRGVDDPTATTRFDWTPLGFHGIVLSEKGTVLIEPKSFGDTANYIAYFQRDVIGSGECDVSEADQEAADARNSSFKGRANLTPAVSAGATLRTYRLALAATAEYTLSYGGGTVSGGLSAVTTTVNLVDAIYERDVAIRLTLIANEDSIIFTDFSSEGYSTDNQLSMFLENQTILDSVIGSANYDIGFVLDGHIPPAGISSSQGVARLGSVCVSGLKAMGVVIFRSVFPTSLYAYYLVAHEFGHQFSATHTFNATIDGCYDQRDPSSAYEPGTGSTIMGYRSSCGTEDLHSTDTYFHNKSIEQIVNYTTNISDCSTKSGTNNNPPAV